MTDDAHNTAKDEPGLKPSALPFGSNERDWLLAHVVRITNLFKIGFDVILYTPTGVITGKTISGQEYFDRVSRSFGDPESDEDENRLAQIFATFGENYKPDLDGASYSDSNPIKSAIPQYIHIEDCKVLQSGQAPFPENDGVLWRGNLDKVIGFTFGTLSTTKKKR